MVALRSMFPKLFNLLKKSLIAELILHLFGFGMFLSYKTIYACGLCVNLYVVLCLISLIG